MTNLYNLSPRPKIVFFHGLNNNQTCMNSFMDYFEKKGHETKFIVLPGHGPHRGEANSLENAMKAFAVSMNELSDEPYLAIAFSQGALYLQLWLEQNPRHKPLKQVLLAPALFLQKQGHVELAIKCLPSFMIVKSITPIDFRRYGFLKVCEYRTLLGGMKRFQNSENNFSIPTMVVVDPKDELIDVERLKKEIKKKNHGLEVIQYGRSYLNKGIGQHHILFHPDYFKPNDWQLFVSMIENFFQSKT